MGRASRLLVGIPIFVVVILPLLSYRVGLWLIPEERLHSGSDRVPEQAIALYWASLGGRGVPQLGRHRAAEVWLERWVGEVESPSPAIALSHRAAEVVARPPLRSNRESAQVLALQAALHWVEGHLSPRVAIARVLDAADYGHGFVGLETAAAGYFGLPAAELNDAELAMLIVTLRGPEEFNPWCHLEENQHAVHGLGDAGLTPPSARLRPARPGRCALRSALS